MTWVWVLMAVAWVVLPAAVLWVAYRVGRGL